MANITLRFSDDPACYGDGATEADMDAMNALMVEYLESLGHDVEVGPETDSGTTDHECDEDDSGDALHQLVNEAWDHACRTYVPAE